MAYKSNKQARGEYLDNEQRNRERNKSAYDRRKDHQNRTRFVILVIAALVIYYLATHRPH